MPFPILMLILCGFLFCACVPKLKDSPDTLLKAANGEAVPGAPTPPPAAPPGPTAPVAPPEGPNQPVPGAPPVGVPTPNANANGNANTPTQTPGASDSIMGGPNPGAPMPPDMEPLEVTVSHLPSSSWNNNCVEIGIGQGPQTTFIPAGCSKEPSSQGKTYLLPAKKGVCNVVRFRFISYPPDRSNCPDKKEPCGNFELVPSVVRNSSNTKDWKSFFAYDVAGSLPLSPMVKLKTFKINLQDDQTLARKDFPNGGKKGGGWVRIFFEDQPPTNLEKGLANRTNRALLDTLGVDYDDAALEIKSKSAMFTLENAHLMQDKTKYVKSLTTGALGPLEPFGCKP